MRMAGLGQQTQVRPIEVVVSGMRLVRRGQDRASACGDRHVHAAGKAVQTGRDFDGQRTLGAGDALQLVLVGPAHHVGIERLAEAGDAPDPVQRRFQQVMPGSPVVTSR